MPAQPLNCYVPEAYPVENYRKAVEHVAKQKYGEFLGEFEVFLELKEYGKGYQLCLQCKDGRKYHSTGGGLSLISKTIESLFSAIEEDYCTKLPRLDRIIRERNL